MIEGIEMHRTTSHYLKLTKILGMESLKWEINSPFDFISIASKGVDAQIIDNFLEYFEITRQESSRLLNISEPTIYRWTKANRILDRNVSIQIFELTDLFLFGEEVFESQEKFFLWLDLPNTSLGGFEPKEILGIPVGVSKVRDILGRIDHGVYS